MLITAARWLCPVASPPIERGAMLTREGEILAVGPLAQIVEQAGASVPVVELGRMAILPGLVNAHCHAELSWMASDRPAGGEYVAWIEALLHKRARGAASEGEPAECTREAIAQMLARGTVAVGDVGNESWVAPLLFASGLEGVLFHEVYSPRAAEAQSVARAALERGDRMREACPTDGRWSVAPSPHAPHTCSAALLRALASDARGQRRPMTIHAAESQAELDWIERGDGPFAQLFEDRSLLERDRVAPGVTSIAWLDQLGLLDSRCLLVHCVHCSEDDVERIRRSRAHVISCPRSNHYLSVGQAPLERYLSAGIPVALGTDSLASSPTLDLLDEMAAVRRLHPSIPAARILRMATHDGAAALGLSDRLGSLEPGKAARPIAVRLEQDGDPLEQICSSPESVTPLSCSTADQAHAC